jgi:hypothetical protein
VGECASLRTDDEHLVGTVHRIGPREADMPASTALFSPGALASRLLAAKLGTARAMLRQHFLRILRHRVPRLCALRWCGAQGNGVRST